MKYRLLFLSGLFALFAWSCETDKLQTFDGDFTYVYFDRQGRGIDFLFFNFAVQHAQHDYIVLEIPVVAAGAMLEERRPIIAELVANVAGSLELTAVLGEDIVFLPSFMEAGSTRGILQVRVNNSERLREGRTLATIRLIANEYFRNDFTVVENVGGHNMVVNAIEYRLFLENSPGIPPLWAAFEGSFLDMMGPFSIVKYETMMRVIGFTPDFLVIREDETPEEAWRRTGLNDFGTWILWSRLMNHYLAYREENGDALRDEHGDLVEMGRTGRTFW